MALNGKITGVYNGYTLETSWTAKQDVAGNYSTITCTHRLICESTYALHIDARKNTITINGETKKYTSPAISTDGGQTITLGTTTHKVNHNLDGSKSCGISSTFYIQTSISGVWVETISASGVINLDTIPRQATISYAANFNDEENPKLTYTNIGGYRVTQAYLRFGNNYIYRNDIGTNGTYEFKLTDLERTQLRNATPNSKSMTINYGITTLIGSTNYNNELAKTMTIVNANPTAPTLDYFDINDTTTEITGDTKRIIRNKSILRAVIGNSNAKKGATIKTYEVAINSVNKQGNGIIDIGTINLSVNADLVLVVTDSRGNRTTVKKNVIIDDYETPTASIQLYRVNNFETSSRIKVDSTYSSLNSKNQITTEYRYKKTSDTTYGSWIALTDKVLTTISLDNKYDWNVQIRIKDKLSDYIVYSQILPKGKPLFYLDTKSMSVGVNMIPLEPNQFAVEGSISATGSFNCKGDGEIDGNLFANGKRVYATENGTWTPKLSCVGESAPTYSTTIVRGNYKKIGNLIFISFLIRGKITALNGTNNYAHVTGLPFTPKDYNIGEQSLGIGIIYGATSSDVNMTMGINGGGIRIQNENGATAASWKITSTSYFEIGASGWYEIA